MSSNIKELIKKEKERRKLMRNEKKKEEKIKLEINSNFSEESNLKIPKNLFLNIQNNYENNAEDSFIKNKNLNINDISKECNALNEEYCKEPTAPVNKLNKNNNLKEAFSEYNNIKNSYFFEENENKDTNKSIMKDKNSISINIKNEDSLPEDFFDSFKICDNKNNKSDIKNGDKIETKNNLNNNLKNHSENEKGKKDEIMKTFSDTHFVRNSKNDMIKNYSGDKSNLSVEQQNECIIENEFENEKDDNVEILETYEIIEPTTYNLDLKENKNFLKRKLEKRKKIENNENEEDEVYKKKKKDSNTDNYNKNNEIGNNDYIMNLFDNNLDDLIYYKPSDTAYYEELDYLHKMLVEKKKNILGNMYDEENEKNKENEVNILEELNEFHKKKNKKENEKNSNFNIDEIYEILNIKKGEHKNDYLNDITNKNEESNSIEKNTQNENIPKGFFDDKEKEIFIREKVSLSTLDQKIAEVKKQKKKILLEYKNVENIYEEKMNNYIDYLYDDKYDNKTEILNELKTKVINVNHLKDKVKKIKKQKNKITKHKKKVNTKLDVTNQIFSDWRKKSFF
ncbi:conserved Plasmodium protein, unknown function [Plasmodium relictum]|uniref:Uncharacterized protein n=1 Tax=Plasmodium relictum TaxID=85471 RepID=A0A1J1H7B7_PLARL|nr:conserved Plasmodium protein, unknown function [Plasmodium relictum]CRH00809.1 conserved Plasmodium protein, unknown function [Plasmodium relictum]